MVLRWMMEGKIFVGTVDLLTVLMIVLLSLDGRLVAPGGAPGAVCRKRAGANNLPAGSVSKLRQEQDTGSEWLHWRWIGRHLCPASRSDAGEGRRSTMAAVRTTIREYLASALPGLADVPVQRVGELTPRLGSDAAIEFRCGFERQDFYCARGDMESRIKEIVLSLPGQSHWHFVIAGGGKVSVDELLAVGRRRTSG
jgi:hypothetical protein